VRQLISAALAATFLLALGGCAAAPQGEEGFSPAAQEEIAARASEMREKVVDCLQERGWDVVLESDGWSIEGTNAEQAESYTQDQEACQEETGFNDLKGPPLTEAQMKDLYKFEVDLAECLRREGYEIPDAPSEQAFIDRYTTTDAWYAYRTVEPTSEESWNELQETCPQFGT
jgi:hypothetical protein